MLSILTGTYLVISSGVIEHIGVEEHGGASYSVRPLPDRDALRARFVGELLRGVEELRLIVEDVLTTGRTARAAMNELMDWGRPGRLLLCVLVDRGGREVPIQPDVVGKVQVDLPNAHVEVLVPELDGELGAYLLTTPEPAKDGQDAQSGKEAQ